MPASSPLIFVTRPIPADALDGLRRLGRVQVSPQDAPIPRAELLAGVAQADALVCMLTDRIDAEVLAVAPQLKVVANFAVGTNNLDLAALGARGIAVGNTPGVLAEATAELAIGLLIDVMRGISSGDRLLRREGFPGWGPLYRLGAGLQGKQLGIVGLGQIGQATARLARAFGMRIVYHQRRRAAAEVETALEASYSSLNALLSGSDAVSLHCPLNEQSRGLIGAQALARFKPGAVLINTARGEVVDEGALVQALRQGSLGGAGLDVFEREPELHAGLADLDNVVLVPHLGSATVETRAAMGRLVVANVAAGLNGAPLPNAVKTL